MSGGGNETMGESLVASSNIRLYDPVCMLDISRDVASGYLILLMGGPEKHFFATEKEARQTRSATVHDNGGI